MKFTDDCCRTRSPSTHTSSSSSTSAFQLFTKTRCISSTSLNGRSQYVMMLRCPKW